MKDVLLAMAVMLAVALGVTVRAQAGPPSEDTLSSIEEDSQTPSGTLEEAPEASEEGRIVWDLEAGLCYTRSGRAPQPPPQVLLLRSLPRSFAYLENDPTTVTPRRDGVRRYRGDWPRGRILRFA